MLGAQVRAVVSTASAYVIYRDKAGNQYTVYSPYKNGSTTINRLLNS